jgi:hypothetical protein
MHLAAIRNVMHLAPSYVAGVIRAHFPRSRSADELTIVPEGRTHPIETGIPHVVPDPQKLSCEHALRLEGGKRTTALDDVRRSHQIYCE